MYAWIFRNLPGPLWLRILTSLLLVAAALFLMVRYLFPWLAEVTHASDNTVGMLLF
ncbi:hypothetical protein [Sinomonas flava]|uniref:hypothetical protein n=1 Tax=Sinomonas flava TaxID=496857 RepID=UPI0039A77B52